MSQIRITKLFSFEMAHSLDGYEGKCRNLHGHSYHLQVTIQSAKVGEKDFGGNGMLFDFGDLKRLVQEKVIERYDHALVLNTAVEQSVQDVIKKYYDKVLIVDFQPTTENLLGDFAQRIMEALPVSIKLYSLRLSETENSFAEWYND